MYELLNGMCIILIKIYVLNGDDKNLATRYKLIDRGYVVARIILSNGNKKIINWFIPHLVMSIFQQVIDRFGMYANIYLLRVMIFFMIFIP